MMLGIIDNKVQTDNFTCNYKKKNNHQVINKLKILFQHLDYNKKTFKKFI